MFKSQYRVASFLLILGVTFLLAANLLKARLSTPRQSLVDCGPMGCVGSLLDVIIWGPLLLLGIVCLVAGFQKYRKQGIRNAGFTVNLISFSPVLGFVVYLFFTTNNWYGFNQIRMRISGITITFDQKEYRIPYVKNFKHISPVDKTTALGPSFGFTGPHSIKRIAKMAEPIEVNFITITYPETMDHLPKNQKKVSFSVEDKQQVEKYVSLKNAFGNTANIIDGNRVDVDEKSFILRITDSSDSFVLCHEQETAFLCQGRYYIENILVETTDFEFQKPSLISEQFLKEKLRILEIGEAFIFKHRTKSLN